MKALLYYLSLPFIYGLSVLPFPVLYAVADVLYLLLYKGFGYRRKVVLQNLSHSFPEKSPEEIRLICNRFYRHLFSLMVETFKTLTISRKEMLRRCAIHPDAQRLMDEYAAANQSVLLMLGHQGQWEWGGNTFSLCAQHRLSVIYHPLHHPLFNQLICRMRTRFDSRLIAMKDTFRDMMAHKGGLNATAFIADQSPRPETAHWIKFLNQDTPFFKGAEKIAQKLNLPVVYVLVHRQRRGFYQLQATTLIENPAGLPDGAITEAYAARLEEDIIKQPATWLWSHRRWKHQRHSIPLPPDTEHL